MAIPGTSSPSRTILLGLVRRAVACVAIASRMWAQACWRRSSISLPTQARTSHSPWRRVPRSNKTASLSRCAVCAARSAFRISRGVGLQTRAMQDQLRQLPTAIIAFTATGRRRARTPSNGAGVVGGPRVRPVRRPCRNPQPRHVRAWLPTPSGGAVNRREHTRHLKQDRNVRCRKTACLRGFKALRGP